MTQCDKIKRHLDRHGDITPVAAISVYGIYRLGAVIYDLRQAGHNIQTEMRKDDEGKKYARYVSA